MKGELLGSGSIKTKNPSIVYNRDHPPAVNMQTKVLKVELKSTSPQLCLSQKNSSFRLPYQRPSSSADCARELLNGSNGSASLVEYTRKKIFCLGDCSFFMSDVISGGLLGHLGPLCLALGVNR